MSYSRRQLYALGEPIGDSATYKEGGRTIYGDGGGGGGGSQPQTSTSYNTNIPEYAKPYVMNMLEAGQKQLFELDDAGKISGFREYQPYSTDMNQYFAGYSPMQQQAFTTAANLGVPNQYAAASGLVGQAAQQGLGAGQTATGLQGTALGYGQAGAGYGDVGQQYGALGAEQAARAAQQASMRAGRFGSQAAGYGAQAAQAAQQGFGAQAAYERAATDPTSMQAYMSPYMQNVVDYQKQQAARDYGIAEQARKAQAVGAGAFGGSRQAIQEAEAQRSLMSQLQGITATGSQQAFQNAQQAQQFGANLGLQGLQAGYAGLGQGIAGAQAGLSGVGQQLAAGQLGLQGTAQGIQGAQAGMQGAGVGLQGVSGAVGAGQYGLSGAQAATQAAQTLGQLGTSELTAQTNIANLQQQYGAQQQALEQQKINQAIQNYATAQQYPYMQLGIMSNLLRGLPMQSTTTSSYQATPSTAQQVAGLGIAGLGAYKSLSGFKEGGTVKGLAAGGPGGVEGSVRAKLEMMSDQQLQQVAKTSPSAEVRAMAQEVLAEHAIRERAEQQARQAIAQEQTSAGLAAAPAPNMDTVGAAGGGIVAFAGRDESLVQDEEEGYDPFAGLSKDDRKLAERQAIFNRAMGVKDNAFADYKAGLAEQRKGLGQAKDYAVGMGLVDVGARIASTPGPWGTAIAESITGALPGFQKNVAEYQRQKADLVKADYEVAKEEQKEALGKANKLTESVDKRDELANRLRQTEIQANATLGAARISSERTTDLMQAYNVELGKLTGGDPSKATPEQKAQAMQIAGNLLRGLPADKLDLQGQKQAQDAVDKSIQSGTLGMINLDLYQANKKLEKNPDDVALKRKVEDLQRKYKTEEARIRQGAVSTTTAAAPTASAPGTMKFDAQGNLITG